MKSNAELWACVEGGRKEGSKEDGTDVNEDWETVKTGDTRHESLGTDFPRRRCCRCVRGEVERERVKRRANIDSFRVL